MRSVRQKRVVATVGNRRKKREKNMILPDNASPHKIKVIVSYLDEQNFHSLSHTIRSRLFTNATSDFSRY